MRSEHRLSKGFEIAYSHPKEEIQATIGAIVVMALFSIIQLYDLVTFLKMFLVASWPIFQDIYW